MSRRELLLESCEARILCDAAPEVSLQAPANAQIGEQIQVTATFDNTSATDTGFGPYIDLVLDTTGADGAGAAIDDGVSFVSASYLGTPVKATVLTFDAAGQAIHPYAKDAAGNPLVVNAPPGYGEGDSLVVLQLPFGSYSPSQPAASVNITLQMSNLADVNTPLNISARGGFQYGNDALDNPETDPSIVDPTYANAAVTPTLFTLKKVYLGPEDETATGPNFERQYRIELDVATGQTLTNVQLNDLLPGNLQFVRVDSLTGGPENVGARLTPGTTTPGGTLSRTITSITGVAGVDATLTFTAYVPRIDSGGAAIIDATTGNDATVQNNISGSGTWTPIDPRDTPITSTVDVAGPEHTLTAKSIVVQKSAAIVTNVGSPGASPGDVVEYTLDVQVSDYFAFQDLKLTDVLSDGQRFDTSFTPTITWTEQGTSFVAQNFLGANYTVTPNYSAGAGDGSSADGTDGTTSIEFRLSPEIARPLGQDQLLLGGGIPAGGIGAGALPNNPPLAFTPGTTVRVKFRAVIQDAFTDDLPSGNPSLNPRDVLTDNVTIDGQLLNVRTLAPTAERETDNSSASITIANTAISKSIYAINGSTTLPTTPSGAVLVRPGDTVTYRLTYSVPSGDVENLVLNDYLPAPIFSAASVTTFSTAAPSATPPPSGQASWGPLETLRDIVGTPTPAISSTPSNNLLSFTYPVTVDDPANLPRTVDLLFTVTVSSAPFADGLFLTNQVQASENNTQQPATSITSDAIIQVVVQQPTIATLRKGVVGYNNTGLTLGTPITGQFTFTAPGTTSTLTGPPLFNPLQAASIGLNDLLGNEVDAGDAVRFAVILQNEGRSDGYDVTFTDQVINPGYNVPVGATDNDRLNAIQFTLFRGDGTTLVRGTDYTATLTAGGLLTVTLIDNYTSGNVAGDTGSGGLSRGFNANNATLVTNGSNTIVATYDLTLSPGVPNLGATVTNTATLTNFASVEGGTDFTPKDITGSGRVKLPQPSLAKALTSTSVVTGNNSNTQAVVGELATYTLTLTVPEGSVAGASISDVLDAGLAFVNVTSVAYSAGLTSSNTIGTGTAPGNVTVTSSGRNLTFNLGTLTNSNTDNAVTETITITYTAVVLNTNTTPNIQAGTQLNNSATFTGQYTDLPTGTATSYTTPVVSAANVTVIEPALTVLKDAATTNVPASYTDSLANVDAGDTVFFRIRITNAAGGPTAFDTLLADTLPTDFSGASIVSVSGGGFTTADFTITGGVLQNSSAAGIDIVAGTTVEIIVQGTLASSVIPAQSITNTANITWTSIDGNPGTISTYDANSTERTGAGGQGADNAVLNNYATSDGTTLTVTAPANTKTIVATSESFTTAVAGTERVAIGEMIRYRLVLTVPEGTSPDLQIVDNLPTGLVFINDGTATVGFVSAANNLASTTLSGAGLDLGSAIIQPTFLLPGTAISTSQTLDNDNYDSGTDVRFKLGTIANSASSNGTAESIVIEFNALVLNTASTGNQSGTTLNNNFTTRINGNTTVGVASANVGVVVAEPNLTVAKAASTIGPVDAGDTFSYTLTITNNASGNNAAPAFDVRVLDLVDQIVAATNPTAELEFLSYTLGTLPSGTTLLTDASSTATDTLDLTFNRLNAGASFTITVNVQVKTGALSGAEIENKAVVTYSSLPGTAGTENGTVATTYGTTDVDLNPGTDSALANADANNGTVNLGANAGERTGADSEATANDNTPPANNAVRNNYAVAANAPANLIVAIPTIDKQFKNGTITADDTSVASSTGANVVIGETVTYDLLVTLPEGVTQDLRVQDIVPDGLRIDSIQIITDGSASLASTAFNGTFTTTPTLASPLTGPTTLTLDFDNVTVASDNVAGNNSFVIRVVATVINILTNQQAVTRTNTAQLLFNDPDGPVNAGPAADRTIADVNAGNDPTVTIVEPTVTIAKSVVAPASPDAGDVLTYTITLTNTSGQTAYDLTLSDALSANLTAATGFLGVVAGSSVTAIGGASVSANAFEIVDLGGGSFVLRTAAGANVDLPNGGAITLTYETTIIAGAGPSTVIPNVGNVRWTSLDGGLDGDDTGTVNERGGSDVADPAPTSITQTSTTGPLNNYAVSSTIITTSTNNIVAAKTIVTTSLGGNDGVVTPGEIVTYQIEVTLPEGVAPDLQIRDAIPTGMAFIPGSIVLDTTGYVGSVSAPAVTPVTGTTYLSGTDITFDFAAITTTADNIAGNNKFVFTYQAVVLDVATNDGVLPGQTTLQNTATHNNGSGTTFSANAGSASVTVVEPNLTVTNTLSITGPRDAGAPFTYTITVNPTANATSGAYEVSIADILPPELTGLSLTSAIVSDGATNTNVSGNFSLVGNALSTTTPLTLLLNTNGANDQTLTLTLTGTLAAGITPNQTVNTSTSLAYTNYPGDRTAAGGFNPTADVTTDRERSYTATDTESFTAPQASFAKSLLSTNQTFTLGSNVAIGEEATFALLVTLPEGTAPNLTVVDLLPPGLQYVTSSILTTAAGSGGLLSADFAGTVPAPTVTGGAANGDDVTFTFGSIATTGDNVTTNNSFLILITARVTNTLANQSGANLPNQATFDITGDGVALFTSPAVNVTVVEPRVTTTKTILSTTTGIDAGDSVTYQITLNNLAANGATTDAFDVALSDVLPAGLLITSIGAPTLNGGAVIDTALTGTGTANLTGIFDIPLGGSVTFTYTAQVGNAVTPGQTLTNDLNVVFSSLDGASANERTGADVADPENNTPPTNNAILNNYAVGADATITAINPYSVTKTLANSSLGNDTATSVAVGEVLTYQLAVSVMEGTTSNLSLIDTLPRVAGANLLSYIPGSATISNANGITVNGFSASYNATTNQLTITATSAVNPGGSNSTTNDPAVAESDTFFITYQVLVANTAGNTSGTVLTNDVDATATGVPPDNNNQVTVTIVEPALSILKTFNTASGDAGDVIQMTVVVRNTGTGTAYDTVISDTIDGTRFDRSSFSLTTPPAGWVSSYSSGSGLLTLTDTNAAGLAVGASATFVFDLTLRSDLAPGVAGSNTASANTTTLPGVDGSERTTPTVSSTANLTVPSALALTKTRQSTSASSTTNADMAIGETAIFRLAVTLEEGTTRVVTFNDTLPTGLGYTAGSAVFRALSAGATAIGATSGNVYTDGSAINASDIVYNPGTGALQFSFRDATIAATTSSATGQFAVDYQALVQDVASNQSGTVLTNVANVSADRNGDGDHTDPGEKSSNSTQTLNVVEPLLAITKTFDVSTANAGDTILVTITVKNNGTATAFDSIITDTLDSTRFDLASFSPVSTQSGWSNVYVSGTGLLTLTDTNAAGLAIGATATFTFNVDLLSSLPPGALVSNTATTTTTTLPGTDPNERTEPPKSATATLNAAATVALEKTLQSTSETGTTGSNMAIGESAIFRLTVTLGEGVTQVVTFNDTLPAGLGYNAATATFRAVTTGASARGAVSGTLYTEGSVLDASDLSYDSGTGALSFRLVDGTIPAGSTTGSGQFAIDYQVTALDVLSNVNAVNLTNSATVSVDLNNNGNATDVGETSSPDSQTLTIVEPALVVTKASNDPDGIVTVGQTVTYTLTVTNNGTATAYDVLLRDVIPAGLLYVSGSATNTAGVAPDASSLTVTGATLTANYASLAVGETSTITFRAVVQSTGSLENNVRIFYDTLTVDEPDNSVITQTPDATPDRDYGATGGFNGVVEAPSATTDPAQDTELVTLGAGSLGDRLWFDRDGDGVQTANEPGLAGVTVTLVGTNPDSTTFTLTTTTDATGTYTFANLAAGNYTVNVDATTLPDGTSTLTTFDLDGVGTPNTASLTLTNGQVREDVDFGYRGTGSLGDLVWLDLDASGTQNGQEPGLANTTLDLVWDANNSGTIDAGDTVLGTTTTDGAGAYSFGNLLAGKYLVQVTDTNGVVTGATATYDLDGTATPSLAAATLVSAGQNRTDVDFGYRGKARISGTSYNDQLKNGSLDGTDTGIGGVTIELVWDRDNNGIDANDPVLTTTTAANGTYAFENLLAGTYYVRETQPSGFGQGTENGTDLASVTLPTASTLAPDVNFGNTTGSISGRVFVDNDNDGTQNGADAGLPGTSVTLQWTGLDGIFGNGDDRSVTVTTDNNGDYIFDYNTTTGFLSTFGDTTGGLLSTGSYRVVETQPADYLDGAETAGNASVNPGGVDEGANPGFAGRGGADKIGIAGDFIQITEGEDATSYTFAELPPSSISGFVYVDYNGDQQKGKTEPGIPGTTVKLTGTDDLGNPVELTVKTDTDGKFLFENLRPGTYTLTETQPGGYTDGPETLGTASGDKSKNDVISGIVLTPGTIASDYLFAEVPIPPVIPPPLEVRPEPPKEKQTPEPFVFAFDSFNNFANTNPSGDEISPWISSIDNWRPAMLPLAPIYSGAANPGATLVIELYNANGVHIGSQTVIADSGGNWLANFTSVVLRDAPSEVRITQTNAPYSFGSGTGHNLRTYYAPAALNPGHFLAQSISGGSHDDAAPLLGGLDLANPIALGSVKYGGEFLASEGVASGD